MTSTPTASGTSLSEIWCLRSHRPIRRTGRDLSGCICGSELASLGRERAGHWQHLGDHPSVGLLRITRMSAPHPRRRRAGVAIELLLEAPIREGVAAEPAVECPHEDRHLQRQQHRRPAARPAPLARVLEAGRRLPAGAEDDRREVPGRGHPRGGLRGRLARPEGVERRRHPRPGREAGGDPARPARRPGRHPQPLYRGRRGRRSPSAASTCPTATPPRVRSSTTS